MYPCTNCGACCKRVHLLENFPFKNINGVCEKYIDNKCSIYENRPWICNIDKGAEILGFNKEEFYKLNIQACNQMMDEDGIDLKFRIK
jgi:Fe-S-cluster containining protein